MGKRLIVKGADFSANAIPENGPIITPPTPSKVNLWRPNVVDGEAVMNDGYFTPEKMYENRAVRDSSGYGSRYIVLIQIDEPGTYEWCHPTEGKATGKNGGLFHAVSWRSMTNSLSAAGYIAGDTGFNDNTNGCRRLEWPEGQTGPLMLLILFSAQDYNGGSNAEDCWGAGHGGYLTRAQVAQCTLYKVD